MHSLVSRLRPYYVKHVALMNSLQSVLLLAIRLYWGWQFFLTGRGKLMNIGRTSEFFASLNIPMPALNAYLAGTTECFGGLLLLVGMGSRVASVPLIGTMLVAYATAHAESVRNLFSNPDDFVTQPPFLFLFAAMLVLVFGPGRFSLDAMLEQRAHSEESTCSTRTVPNPAAIQN